MKEFAMHDAAEDGNLERVRQLIEAGVPVDSLNENGQNPLHVAASNGRYEVAALLIHSKCNINLQDRDGRTPVRLAIDCGSGRDIVILLLRHGANVDCADAWGTTLLHCVSSIGWVDIVRLILDKGEADLNAADRAGVTPLMLAVSSRHREVTALLLRAGADFNMKDTWGNTALNVGIRNRILTHEEIGLFVQKGAFLENYDYECISQNPLLRENVLTDVELCTQSIVNKFNRQSLPALNSITDFARSFPNIDNYTLGPQHVDEVRNLVQCDIERNTYCNVVNVRPRSLSALCVLSLTGFPRVLESP